MKKQLNWQICWRGLRDLMPARVLCRLPLWILCSANPRVPISDNSAKTLMQSTFTAILLRLP